MIFDLTGTFKKTLLAFEWINCCPFKLNVWNFIYFFKYQWDPANQLSFPIAAGWISDRVHKEKKTPTDKIPISTLPYPTLPTNLAGYNAWKLSAYFWRKEVYFLER